MLSPAIKSQILDYQLEQNQKHLQHFSPAVNGGLPSFDLMNMSFCLREEFSCVTTTTTRGFDHHNHDCVFPERRENIVSGKRHVKRSSRGNKRPNVIKGQWTAEEDR